MAATAATAERRRIEKARLSDAGSVMESETMAIAPHENDELESLWRQAMRDCGEDIPE
jgi:hypothetical protein